MQSLLNMSTNTNNQNKEKKGNSSRLSRDKFNISKKVKKPNNLFGNVFFYLFLIIALYTLFVSVGQATQGSSKEVPISEVISLINDEKVQDIVVSGDDLEILLADGTNLTAKKESTVSFDDILADIGLGKRLAEAPRAHP